MINWVGDFFHRPLSPDPTFDVTSLMLQNAGIGRNYWGCSIAKIPDRCGYKKSLTEMVNRLHLDVPRGRGAILWGSHGFGKTSAAAILLKAAMARGGQCSHRMAATLEHAHTKRWVETNLDGIEIWDVLTNSQLLVIDDLGQEQALAGYKAGDTRMVEELIRARYDARLVTYITTNLKPSELINTYSPIDTILLEKARYATVRVDGHNWRARGSE